MFAFIFLFSIFNIIYSLPLDSISKSAEDDFVFKHHNNEELVQVLNAIHQKCPDITRVYTLAEKSVLGVPLTVIEFSDHPGVHKLRKLFCCFCFYFLSYL